VGRPRSLLEHVEAFLSRVSVDQEPGVVAVSAGPDSVALARLLSILQREKKVGPLILAHLNHQLRAMESDEDQAFVAELAKQLSRDAGLVGFRGKRLDIAALARERGDNLENVAREVRYEWFAEVAREEGARWIAVGHTADDQAETVLHRLVRGTGLHGLAGIPSRRELTSDIEVIRPLLRITRGELLAFLEAEQQPFRIDSSNSDAGFTRNRIRRELLPELARNYNPAVVSILCRLAEQAGEVQRLIEAAAVALFRQSELPRAANLIILQHSYLAAAPRHLVRELFRLLWKRERWPERSMGFDDWERLACLIDDGDSAIDLPDGIQARRRGRVIQVGAA
jgi:tRNA(Ile)-lysidine synthase